MKFKKIKKINFILFDFFFFRFYCFNKKMSIIYGLIAQKNKPLCDYSEYKGTFTTICLKTLSKCTENKGLLTIENTYNIFYKNESEVTFLFLCEKSYPQEAAIVCLDKTSESFFKTFQYQTDFSNYTQYGLNNQFQKHLIEIMQKYNSDSKNLDDSISSLKENLLSMHKQVISTSEIVNERGDKIKLIVEKAEELSHDSMVFADTASRVKRLERWRKIRIYVIIAVVIILFIVCIIIWNKLTNKQ